MPMWHIYVADNLFTDEDKAGIAQKITDLYETYVRLPRFYVSVVFHEFSCHSIYMGGEPATNFVRIWMDHVAVHQDNDERFRLWFDIIGEALAPWVRDRGHDWEIHGDETPRAFWEINGMIPPQTGSEDEQRWIRENRPSPLTSAQNSS